MKAVPTPVHINAAHGAVELEHDREGLRVTVVDEAHTASLTLDYQQCFELLVELRKKFKIMDAKEMAAFDAAS